MINDSQTETVQRMYNFNIRRYFSEDDQSTKAQMGTPDTSYGNLLTRFGYVGGTVLLFLWIYIAYFAWKSRKKDEWMFVLFLLTSSYILLSFSGNLISDPKNLSIVYYIITLSLFRQAEKEKSGINVEVDNSESTETEEIGPTLETEVSVTNENHPH